MKGESKLMVFALAETGATGMETLTTNATSIIDLVKTAMGLFSEFPLNLILVASLIGVAFGIFRKAKRAAH